MINFFSIPLFIQLCVMPHQHVKKKKKKEKLISRNFLIILLHLFIYLFSSCPVVQQYTQARVHSCVINPRRIHFSLFIVFHIFFFLLFSFQFFFFHHLSHFSLSLPFIFSFFTFSLPAAVPSTATNGLFIRARKIVLY